MSQRGYVRVLVALPSRAKRRGDAARRAGPRGRLPHQSWPSSDHSRGGRIELRMSSVCEPGFAPAGLLPFAPAFFVVFTSTGGSYLTSEAVGEPLMAALLAVGNCRFHCLHLKIGAPMLIY
jgi:hypothetical protein